MIANIHISDNRDPDTLDLNCLRSDLDNNYLERTEYYTLLGVSKSKTNILGDILDTYNVNMSTQLDILEALEHFISRHKEYLKNCSMTVYLDDPTNTNRIVKIEKTTNPELFYVSILHKSDLSIVRVYSKNLRLYPDSGDLTHNLNKRYRQSVSETIKGLY